MIRNLLIICTILLIFIEPVHSQVCGVSASKIGACNATPVPAGNLEFEPLFVSMWSKKIWDGDGQHMPRFESSDSIEHSSTLAFRTTYGISNNLEAGVMMTSDLTHIGAAGKYRFFNRNNHELGLLFGYNYSRAGDEESNPGPIHIHANAAAFGLTWTHWINDKVSVDADLQYQKDFIRNQNGNFVFLNSDAGIYFKSGLQAIMGFSYHRGWQQEADTVSELATLNLGASIETGENFILVFGLPVCVYGRNEVCYQGFSLAVTLLFN